MGKVSLRKEGLMLRAIITDSFQEFTDRQHRIVFPISSATITLLAPLRKKGIEKALIVQKQDYFDKFLQNPWPA